MVKKRQVAKKTGMFRVTASLAMTSKKMSAANAKKLKADIRKKSPKARIVITKA